MESAIKDQHKIFLHVYKQFYVFLIFSLITGNFEWNLSEKSRTVNKYQDACVMSIGPRIIDI